MIKLPDSQLVDKKLITAVKKSDDVYTGLEIRVELSKGEPVILKPSNASELNAWLAEIEKLLVVRPAVGVVGARRIQL